MDIRKEFLKVIAYGYKGQSEEVRLLTKEKMIQKNDWELFQEVYKELFNEEV